MGLEGIGSSIEEAFEEAAKAMFGLMGELEKINPREVVNLEVEGRDHEELFYSWMSELLAESSVRNMIFSSFQVDSVDKSRQGGYILRGGAKGEKIESGRLEGRSEVKGVTFMGLRVKQEGSQWKARCVVDM